MRQQGYDVAGDCAKARNEYRAKCADQIVDHLDDNHPYAQKKAQDAASRASFYAGLASCGAQATGAGAQALQCQTTGATAVWNDTFSQCRGQCPAPRQGTAGCIPDGAHAGVAFSAIPVCGEIKRAFTNGSCECKATPACKAYVDLTKQLSANAVGGTSINCNQVPGGVLRAQMTYDASGRATGAKKICVRP